MTGLDRAEWQFATIDEPMDPGECSHGRVLRAESGRLAGNGMAKGGSLGGLSQLDEGVVSIGLGSERDGS